MTPRAFFIHVARDDHVPTQVQLTALLQPAVGNARQDLVGECLVLGNGLTWHEMPISPGLPASSASLLCGSGLP